MHDANCESPESAGRRSSSRRSTHCWRSARSCSSALRPNPLFGPEARTVWLTDVGRRGVRPVRREGSVGSVARAQQAIAGARGTEADVCDYLYLRGRAPPGSGRLLRLIRIIRRTVRSTTRSVSGVAREFSVNRPTGRRRRGRSRYWMVSVVMSSFLITRHRRAPIADGEHSHRPRQRTGGPSPPRSSRNRRASATTFR